MLYIIGDASSKLIIKNDITDLYDDEEDYPEIHGLHVNHITIVGCDIEVTFNINDTVSKIDGIDIKGIYAAEIHVWDSTINITAEKVAIENGEPEEFYAIYMYNNGSTFVRSTINITIPDAPNDGAYNVLCGFYTWWDYDYIIADCDITIYIGMLKAHNENYSCGLNFYRETLILNSNLDITVKESSGDCCCAISNYDGKIYIETLRGMKSIKGSSSSTGSLENITEDFDEDYARIVTEAGGITPSAPTNDNSSLITVAAIAVVAMVIIAMASLAFARRP